MVGYVEGRQHLSSSPWLWESSVVLLSLCSLVLTSAMIMQWWGQAMTSRRKRRRVRIAFVKQFLVLIWLSSFPHNSFKHSASSVRLGGTWLSKLTSIVLFISQRTLSRASQRSSRRVARLRRPKTGTEVADHCQYWWGMRRDGIGVTCTDLDKLLKFEPLDDLRPSRSTSSCDMLCWTVLSSVSMVNCCLDVSWMLYEVDWSGKG